MYNSVLEGGWKGTRILKVTTKFQSGKKLINGRFIGTMGIESEPVLLFET
jgi:hypothetical protein